MSITVSETAVLTNESLGQVEFTYTENGTDSVSIRFHPESKNGYQSIATDSKTTIRPTESMFNRTAARNIWNRLIEMGFHL